MEEARIRIAEDGLSFLKPHSMLGPIAPIFPLVPLEPEHLYILSRYNLDCKCVARKANVYGQRRIIREFREKLASYVLESDTPVAITRHGDTVGYYIPARCECSEADTYAITSSVSSSLQLRTCI